MPLDQLATLRIDGLDTVVLVTEYTCEERVSQLFTATIEVACAAGDVRFDAIALAPAHLTIRGAHSQRVVHGVVTRWEYLRTGREYTFYRVTLAPRAHRLTLRQDMRIFQRLTTPEIVREVLLAAGLQPDEFRVDVVRDHPQRDYCVQYRETDLDFFHRILAREGMFYLFEHGDDAAVLIVADHPKVHTPPPGLAGPLQHDGGFATTRDRLTAFRAAAQIRPGKLTLRDFDPLRPSLPVEVGHAPGLDEAFEVYDFPGGFVEEGLPFLKLGTGAASSAFGQVQAGRDAASGASDCPALAAGNALQLADNPRADLDGEYVITEIVHRGQQPGVAQVEAHASGSYANEFSCVPAGAPVPLPQASARPQIPGIQSAVVVGPKGQPIHTDHLGRIKVQFHWDRQGQRDDRSSCWVRVVQPWGGPQHGFVSVPRVGAEVAVAFLEGDADRPLVLGCMYSDDNPPPHALPHANTRTAWRSQSVPGDGYNELCFEDSGGGEHIFLRAERDHSVKVQRDVKTTIDRSAHTTVKDTRATRVGTDHLTVDRHRVEAVHGDSATTVDGTLVLTARNFVLEIDDALALAARGDLGVTARSALTLTSAGDLCIRGPGGFITINDQGVYIEGTKIFLNSGGQPVTGQAPATPKHDPPTTPTPADEP
jgi:type VI secretion system secreted protein VgrG